MKKILLILFISITTFGFSQKVKVKKGKIIVDGVEVGIIEAEDKKEIKYAVKDLTGKDLFKVDVDIAEGSTRPFEFNWMTISSEDYPQVNVVDYSMISMSLSHPKIIAEILTKNYAIFSKDGLNNDKVAEFFAAKRFSEYKEKATGNGGVDMVGQNEGFDGKIKIKKNQVLFDKKAIANIKNEDQGIYLFTSLDGSEKLTIKYFSLYIHEEFDEKWLEIIDTQNRSSEVKMEYLSISGGLNQKKGIIELLSEKYNLLTENGIENLDAFYAVKRIKLSKGYQAKYDEIQKSKNERAKSLEARLADFKVDEDGNIFATKDENKIGRIVIENKSIQNTGGNRNLMVIGDINDKVIGKFEGTDASNYKATMFDKKELNFNSKVISPDSNKKEFYEEVVLFTIIAGYDNVLEYSIQDYLEKEKEIAIKEYNAKKAKSPNFYGQNGHVIDEEGKKWEGKISLEFEEIKNPSSSDDFGNIINLDGGGKTKYGKEVIVAYLNKKGKKRFKTFNSKNHEEVFVVNADGTKTKYIGIKTNPDAFSVIKNASGISFNYSGYYKVLNEDTNGIIFVNPLNGKIGIKTTDSDKGYFFNNTIQTKKVSKLKEYLAKCNDIPENLLNSDFSTVSDSEELLKYYTNSCK